MPGTISKISPLWELAQALGLVAVVLCLALMLLPVRARTGPARIIALRQHQWIGWASLALAVLHILLSIVADRVVIEHLRLTAPYYEWAGLLALLLLLLLCPLAVTSLRRRFWNNHRRFQAVHVAGAGVLVPALVAHTVTTGHFIGNRLIAPSFVVLGALATLALLRPRRGAARPPGVLAAGPAPGRLAFGRHSRRILFIAIACAAATSGLLSARASIILRGSLLPRSVPVAVEFPHEEHRAVECITCHHNFVDRTGSGSCFACHRSARSDLKVAAEARFHDFCLGCHRHPPRHFEHPGPVTGCTVCHAQSQH